MYFILFTVIGATVAGLIGLLILLRNPKSPTHWWLAFFILASCSWIIIGNIQTFLPEQLFLPSLRVTFIASVLVAFSMLYFAKSVTGSAIFTKQWYIDLALLVMAIVLSMSNLVIENIMSFDVNSLRPLRGIAYPFVLLLTLQFILRGLYIIESTRRKSHGRKRAQFNLISSGLIIGTGLAVLTNVILPNITGDTSTSRLAFLAVAIWTTMLIYAVVQQRFLDIRLAIVRGLGYVAALITVLGLYLGVITFVVLALLPEAARANSALQGYEIIVAAIAAITFQPIRRFFDQVTKAVFYRNAYDSQEVLDRISSSFVQSVDTIKLSRSTLEHLFSSIRPVFVSITILASRSSRHNRIISIGKTSKSEEGLADFLKSYTPAIVAEDDAGDISPSVAHQLSKAEVGLSVRIGPKDNVIGYIFFGRKATGSAFTTQDINLAHLVAEGLAVAIQNALRFEEIQRFNDTLKQRIEEATKELRTTNSQLQRLDEAKDEFLSMASHQLRTPLTSVKGYISMVLEEDAGKITVTQRQLLSEAFASSERMVHLINDFLNVSRLQTGKFMLEQRPIDLSKLVLQEVESLQTTAQMHALKIRYKKPSYFPSLNIDEAKIRQVIMNFIDNAIYYSPEATVITVELAIEDGQATLKVKDTGIGVPKSEQQHLFSKFFRATNARKQRPDGTGVGLFLAKKVIDAHGGSMAFESTEGQGSMFGFRLPIKKLSPKEPSGTKKLKD